MSLLFSLSVERNALVKNGHALARIRGRHSKGKGEGKLGAPLALIVLPKFRFPCLSNTCNAGYARAWEPGLGARQERSALLLLLVALRLARVPTHHLCRKT